MCCETCESQFVDEHVVGTADLQDSQSRRQKACFHKKEVPALFFLFFVRTVFAVLRVLFLKEKYLLKIMEALHLTEALMVRMIWLLIKKYVLNINLQGIILLLH